MKNLISHASDHMSLCGKDLWCLRSRKQEQEPLTAKRAKEGKFAHLGGYQGLCRLRQTPLVLQVALHRLENEAVDDISDRDDQNHDGEHGAHVVEIAAHHQHLPQAEAEIKHFSSDQ